MTTTISFTKAVAGCFATLLATSALVAVATTTAVAGSGTTAYTCTVPGAGTTDVDAVIPDLAAAAAPRSLAEGAISPEFVFHLDPTLVALFGSASELSVSDMELVVGSEAVPLQGFAFVDGVAATAHSSGFTLPEPGSYDVVMPTSFTITGVTGIIPIPTSVPCTTDAPATLGSITALGSSTTEANLAKDRIRKGKRATVTALVSVAPLPLLATGDVVVTKRKKTIGTGALEDGAVTIRTEKFKKPGTYVLKVRYLGDDLSAGSLDEVTLRVKRERR